MKILESHYRFTDNQYYECKIKLRAFSKTFDFTEQVDKQTLHEYNQCTADTWFELMKRKALQYFTNDRNYI